MFIDHGFRVAMAGTSCIPPIKRIHSVCAGAVAFVAILVLLNGFQGDNIVRWKVGVIT